MKPGFQPLKTNLALVDNNVTRVSLTFVITTHAYSMADIAMAHWPPRTALYKLYFAKMAAQY